MNENSFQADREDYLDFLCANYYDLRLFCLDYDLTLPMSEDLGFVRDYLDANLPEVLDCLFRCCDLSTMEGVIRNYKNELKERSNRYGENKIRNY